MKVLTRLDIEDVWKEVGVYLNLMCFKAADAIYAIPDKKWLLDMAAKHAWNLGDWRNSFDCDKFSFSLKLETQRLHADKTEKVDGLLVGVVFYIKDGLGGHAINWSISRGQLYFIEPMTGEEEWLSQKELSSVFFVYV